MGKTIKTMKLLLIAFLCGALIFIILYFSSVSKGVIYNKRYESNSTAIPTLTFYEQGIVEYSKYRSDEVVGRSSYYVKDTTEFGKVIQITNGEQLKIINRFEIVLLNNNGEGITKFWANATRVDTLYLIGFVLLVIISCILFFEIRKDKKEILETENTKETATIEKDSTNE